MSCTITDQIFVFSVFICSSLIFTYNSICQHFILLPIKCSNSKINKIQSIHLNYNQNYKLQIMTKYKKEVEVSIPQAYDLGFCSINHTSSFPFTIFNPNLKPISYLFKFTEFAVVPSKGTLMPNSMTNFKI